MAKKLVIFVGPQLDDDPYCEANFVVRVRHSKSWTIVASPDASQVAGLVVCPDADHPRHKYNLNPQFGLIETRR
jgi:hypothetical protein